MIRRPTARAIVLLIAFAALAETFGLEVILGAFAAGAVLTLILPALGLILLREGVPSTDDAVTA